MKHAILTKYFAAYLTALRKTAEAFHYIDGFAGPGSYGEGEAGSPLHAIELLAVQPLPASASFVENDSALFKRLEDTILQAPGATELFDPPLLRRGEFSDWIDLILERPIYSRFRRVATFAFVDPCGVKGLRMIDLKKILTTRFGECLVFWNYDGLNRWLGGVAAGTHARANLSDFYGSVDAAAEALAIATSASNRAAKERALHKGYLRALREGSGALFIIPFRFQATDSRRTSHYVIHLSRHQRAFTIMKEVMSKEASAEDVGVFEYVPKDELGAQADLFSPNADSAKLEVLDALSKGEQPVTVFTSDWPSRPEDFLVQAQYKQILLELENDGIVEVLDGKTGLPRPANKRLKAGKVTLGDRCIVRLRRT